MLHLSDSCIAEDLAMCMTIYVSKLEINTWISRPFLVSKVFITFAVIQKAFQKTDVSICRPSSTMKKALTVPASTMERSTGFKTHLYNCHDYYDYIDPAISIYHINLYIVYIGKIFAKSGGKVATCKVHVALLKLPKASGKEGKKGLIFSDFGKCTVFTWSWRKKRWNQQSIRLYPAIAKVYEKKGTLWGYRDVL